MTAAAERIRVLIADDHAMVRGGLRLLLQAQGEFDVIGEASDGVEVVKLARETDPDVVLLDLSMPGPGGTRVIGELRHQAKRTKVLVITMHEEDAYVRSALDAGAAGYVAKHVDGSTLIAAIRSVHRGRVVVNVSRPSASPAVASIPLSQRERQVLVQLAQGHSNKATAERLGLSIKTVESYRTRLGNKLNLRTRADLFRYAFECGFLGADSGAEAEAASGRDLPGLPLRPRSPGAVSPLLGKRLDA